MYPFAKNILRICSVTFLILFVTGCEELLTDLDASDDRERIVDTWKCNESDPYLKSARSVYWVEIDKHPSDSNRVIIFNFFDLDEDIYAEVIVSGNNLTLPNQTLEGGFTFHGSGQVSRNADEIDWEYFFDDGSGEDKKVTAVYTRL